MLTRRRFLHAAVVAGAGAAAAPAVWALLAESPQTDGPPEIAYGRDQCDACGMIIGDTRFAGATREGTAAHRYDDIGCLVTHSGRELVEARTTAFVHDAVTEAWMPAAGASFVRSPRIRTPMGYGLAAYDNPSGARAADPEAPVMTFQALLADRPRRLS